MSSRVRISRVKADLVADVALDIAASA